MGVCRSSYYAAKKRRQVINVERLCQRAKLQELFEDSRRSAGSRTLVLQMERLFHSLKTEWMPPLGYRSINAAREDLSRYSEGYYNWRRPHTANGGLPPAVAEGKPNLLSSFG